MQDLLSIWWIWLAAALVLAILEVLAPGFIFLGFAIGAAFMALVVASLTLTWPIMLVVWASLSLIAWLAMRRFFALPQAEVKHFDHDIND